ncbi:hypothetical protein BpHYR1_026323 [Brachionus plicatilis]|uniref:Uncharacterized protein n=1 Tax=Brachionus plicatilis TaxID=10195 RepID=A0A3M7QS94_BRAPC|nr:hypothetical protein BpHYR1_026323 [Brachionus plicatilis]
MIWFSLFLFTLNFYLQLALHFSKNNPLKSILQMLDIDNTLLCYYLPYLSNNKVRLNKDLASAFRFNKLKFLFNFLFLFRNCLTPSNDLISLTRNHFADFWNLDVMNYSLTK